MFDREEIARAAALRAAWEAGELRAFLDRQPESRPEYRTLSGLPLRRVYTAEDLAEFRQEDLGLPGRYPCTRGPDPTMDRGRLWTMRQIAGYGTGEDTNRRFRYLIEQGQTGLSVDFDMPTLMGYDSDDPRSLGEVGREGVAVDTVEDVEELFDGIDLERISVSMTINPTAWILLAMYGEVANLRDARRSWARLMKARFSAERPESMRLRFHCQTAAATLTKTQPYNNLIRTAFQALAAVLGGAQSLHTNGLDEAYAIPSEEAMKLALRTQQIIADETRVPNVVDPLGGSYYVEALTTRIEREVLAILNKVDAMGGTIAAIEAGWFQREIADSAYDFARRKASGEAPVIGVNTYVEPAAAAPDMPIHKLQPETEARPVARRPAVRARRDEREVARLMDGLAEAASDPAANLMEPTIALVRARASMGEIVNRLRNIWGTYVEKPVF